MVPGLPAAHTLSVEDTEGVHFQSLQGYIQTPVRCPEVGAGVRSRESWCLVLLCAGQQSAGMELEQARAEVRVGRADVGQICSCQVLITP